MSKNECIKSHDTVEADIKPAANVHEIFNGADRSRTCDFVLAKHALSQLSYSPDDTPDCNSLLAQARIRCTRETLPNASPAKVGLERLELSTPSLSEKCSNQLSYRPYWI